MPEGHSVHRIARQFARNFVGLPVHASSPQGRFAEGAAVLKAAGIAHDEHAGFHRDLLKSREIPGIERAGSSSLQSLARGAGSIETDYLNGEIVLIARRHGIEAPVNAWFARLGHRMLIEGMAPGSVDPAEAARALPGI